MRPKCILIPKAESTVKIQFFVNSPFDHANGFDKIICTFSVCIRLFTGNNYVKKDAALSTPPLAPRKIIKTQK